MRAFRWFVTMLVLMLGVWAGPARAAMDCDSMGAGWKIDGLYGAYTRRAVTQFQRANRLAVDGVAGPVTLAALKRKYRRTLSCGASGADVRALQAALAARGYWRDGRAHAAARVAMARAAVRPRLPARPLASRPHVASKPRVAARPRALPRPRVAAHKPAPPVIPLTLAPHPRPPAIPLTVAPRPRPSVGNGWIEPVPFVSESRPVTPLPAIPKQFSRPMAEVVPIDIVTPPPVLLLASPDPSMLPSPQPLLRDPEAPMRKGPPISALPTQPVRAGPPAADPVVEGHAGGWLVARNRDPGAMLPLLTGDATAWAGDWGLEVAATNVDAPPTPALIYNLAAAHRFSHGAYRVSAGYQGVGAGLSHMASVSAEIEQPFGETSFAWHAGARGATNFSDYSADAQAGLGLKAGPGALEVGLRGLVLRSAAAGIVEPTDYIGPYVRLKFGF
jgi:peptidoglycan hydrolase-like protein with peptidoglycan-binding domain